MARTADRDPAHMDPALEVAAQILDSKARVIRAIITSNPIRGISNNSQGIRVIQSNLIAANITFSPQACASEIRWFINER